MRIATQIILVLQTMQGTVFSVITPLKQTLNDIVTNNQELRKWGSFSFMRNTPMYNAAQLIVTVVVAVLGSNGLWAWIQSRSTAKSARDRMILGLGHAEIFRVAEKYIHRNGITMTELDDLEKYLYKPYSDMGGNGTAAAIVQKCKELPIISEQEAERRDNLESKD